MIFIMDIVYVFISGTNVHSLDHSGRSPLHLARSRLQRLKLDSPFTSYQLKMEVIQVRPFSAFLTLFADV